MKKPQYFVNINPTVLIPQNMFSKEKFFNAKFISVSNDFREKILPEIKDTITSAQHTLSLLMLNESLYDEDIIEYLGKNQIRTPYQWAQEFCSLIYEQRYGEDGPLIIHWSSVCYVKLQNEDIVLVSTDWNREKNFWECSMWAGEFNCEIRTSPSTDVFFIKNS